MSRTSLDGRIGVIRPSIGMVSVSDPEHRNVFNTACQAAATGGCSIIGLFDPMQDMRL